MHGNGPAEAPGDSLESAAEDLRAGAGALAAESPEEWARARSRQIGRLLDWACKAGCLRPAGTLLPPSELDGAEHRVAFDPALQLWIKTTKPGLYGMHAFLEHVLGKGQRFEARLEYGHALPLQYLDRLLLANEVFGDLIRLRSVVETPEGPSLETTQPDIEGGVPAMETIGRFMRGLGFTHVPDAGPTWYRPEDNVLAIDAQPWNFIETAAGDVLPFDVGLQRPFGELLDHLQRVIS